MPAATAAAGHRQIVRKSKAGNLTFATITNSVPWRVPARRAQFASSATFGSQGYMSSFNISATPPSDVAIGPDGVRRVVFSVANGTGRTIMAAAELRPSDAAAKDWLSIEGENERTFEAAGTQTFKVKVTPSEDASPGRYTFRLRVVATNEPPDELEAWSEPVAFDVAERPIDPKPVVIDGGTTPPPTDWWRIIAIGLGTLAVVVLLAIGIAVAGGGDDDGSPEPTVTASPGVTSSPAATPTAGPTLTAPPSVIVTKEPTPEVCGPRSEPGMLVFDCLPGGGMSTQVIAGVNGTGYAPVPGVTLFFYPEEEQDSCAVNGGLAILAPGDPGTNLPFPVLTPSLQTDPRQCNDYGLDIRFADGVTSLTIEVPVVDQEYGATVWDQTGQTRITTFQGLSSAGPDGLIAVRFTSSQRFYFAFVSRLPNGEPLYIRSIRYTQ